MTEKHAAILGKVGAVIGQVFTVPPGYVVSDQTTASDIDGWDSLSHSILIMKIEEAFKTDLPVEQVYEVNNVGELVDLISASAEGAG